MAKDRIWKFESSWYASRVSISKTLSPQHEIEAKTNVFGWDKSSTHVKQGDEDEEIGRGTRHSQENLRKIICVASLHFACCLMMSTSRQEQLMESAMC